MKWVRSSLCCVLLILVGVQSAAAQEDPFFLSFGIGHKATLDDDVAEPLLGKIEFRFKPLTRWRVAPSIGLSRSEGGASFLFTDISRDFELTEQWIFTPSFGFGSFDDGNDVQLGNDLEFRSGIRLGYRLQNNMRIAVEVFHLSNAGFGDTNPGTEPILIALFIPL